MWRRVPGLNACLEASWEGPFVVLSKLTDVNYKIAPKGSKGKSRGKVVHLNHLKEYVENSNVFAIVAVCEEECEDATVNNSSPNHSINSSLSIEYSKSITEILEKHVDIFSEIPGCTSTVSHSISVSCELPIWTPSYTVPAHLEAGFQRSIEELLRLDIIEPSTSAWSSPHIPIMKKDGDVRIVCDYRKLNSVTLPEPFKMSTIEEILSRLGRAKFLFWHWLCSPQSSILRTTWSELHLLCTLTTKASSISLILHLSTTGCGGGKLNY